MFSCEHIRAIEEKYSQLERYDHHTLSGMNTKRSIEWADEHIPEMLRKYSYLSLPEQGYRIALIEHMGIDPDYSPIVRVSPRKIRINLFDFCPCLEACRSLGIDTRKVCRNVMEPPIQAIIEKIHPNLHFSRNYDNTRPHSDFCEGYIELL